MSWALEWLELPADADERAIKRAYAARLRATRPDTDPEGFQHLHEAYRAALDGRRDAQRDDADDADDAPAWAVMAALEEHATWSAEDMEPWQGAHAAVESEWRDTLDPTRSVGVLHATHDIALPDQPQTLAPEPPSQPSSCATDVAPQQPPPLPELARGATADDDVCSLEQIVDQARRLPPGNLADWLNAAQMLWSLTSKAALSNQLHARLMEQDEPIRSENTQVLIDFFQWDDINAPIDPECLLRRQRRMQVMWALQADRPQQLRAHLASCDIDDAELALLRIARLRQGMSPGRRLLAGVRPLAARRMRGLLDAFDFSPACPALPQLDQQTAAFWHHAGDHRRISLAWLQISALRWGLAWLVSFACMLLVSTSPGRIGRFSVGLLLAWLAWVTLVALSRWLNAMSFQYPWRLCIPPALALISVLVIHLGDARIAGTVIAGLTLLLTARCLWLLVNERRRLSRWRLLILVPGVKGLALIMIIGELAAVMTIVLWLTVVAMVHKTLESIKTG
ncbi:hypothetical protein [Stenotrophomonas rhizophila]|uniref:hypothetical protein n=1 Tax=Stenotrophomonas rhizophila TaxID=216778 RepID=UPI001E301ABB|nr:hypothetical protein [Stenotrophomonas rhizophila]